MQTYKPRTELPSDTPAPSSSPPPSASTSSSLRPVFLKVGTVSQARGSAYVETHETKLVCSVYGPRSLSSSSAVPRSVATSSASSDERGQHGHLVVDVKFAPFALMDGINASRRRFRGPSDEERAVAQLVQGAVQSSLRLETFPKSVVEAYVEVLECGAGTASLLGVAVTCVSLALADAGVEMLGLVAGCSAAVVSVREEDEEDEVEEDGRECVAVLDPSESECVRAEGVLTLASMPTLNEMTYVAQTGRMESEQAKKLLEMCVDGCATVHALMRDCLIASLQN